MLSFLSPEADPDSPAIVLAEGSVWRYADLDAAVAVATVDLQAAVSRSSGQLVAIAVSDPLGTLVAVLAVLQSGHAVMPLDVRAGDAHRKALIERGRPAAVITAVSPEGRLSLTSPAHPPRRVDAGIGLLLFTSGSSGEPKGVLLTRSGIQANVAAILSYLPVRQFPRTALVLPLSYSYALVGQAFVTLQAGGVLLMIGDGTFPLPQLARMRELQATGLSSVPTALRRLCEAAATLPEAERPPLGYLASAGAPLDSVTRTLMAEAFPHARRFNQYGLTEACPRVTALSDQESPFERGSVGRALPGISLHIVDEAGHPLPPGQTGQLVVDGPSVMAGYLDDPPGTGQVLRPDGLHAGDMGWLDDDGYLYVTGRRDGLVKCGGERVSTEEVAQTLRGLPDVADAHVVALPDDVLGHRLVAFVEAPEAAVPAIRVALRSALPPAKRPQRIVPLPGLPRSANGKVAAADLRAMADAERL